MQSSESFTGPKVEKLIILDDLSSDDDSLPELEPSIVPESLTVSTFVSNLIDKEYEEIGISCAHTIRKNTIKAILKEIKVLISKVATDTKNLVVKYVLADAQRKYYEQLKEILNYYGFTARLVGNTIDISWLDNNSVEQLLSVSVM
jgi:hypothetical protein